MESRVTAARSGPAVMETLLLRCGCPSGRDAGSIPCLRHGKRAKPSPGAKLEFALSWVKNPPGGQIQPSCWKEGRGVGVSATLPSAGAAHAELVRQARPEVLMKL